MILTLCVSFGCINPKYSIFFVFIDQPRKKRALSSITQTTTVKQNYWKGKYDTLLKQHISLKSELKRMEAMFEEQLRVQVDEIEVSLKKEMERLVKENTLQAQVRSTIEININIINPDFNIHA